MVTDKGKVEEKEARFKRFTLFAIFTMNETNRKPRFISFNPTVKGA
jgi:hypothetical protein